MTLTSMQRETLADTHAAGLFFSSDICGETSMTTDLLGGQRLLDGYADAAMKGAVTRHTDEGTAIAEIPQLDGVWTYGTTEREALHDLRETLLGWLELKIELGDRDIPVIDGFDLSQL